MRYWLGVLLMGMSAAASAASFDCMANTLQEKAALRLCCIGTVCAAEQEFPTQDMPLWHKEVVPDLNNSRLTGSRLLVDSDQAGLAFVNDKQLVVYAVDKDIGQLTSRVSPDVSSSFRLHIWLFSDSGTLINTTVLGTLYKQTAVKAVSGGVLVEAGDTLRLYSNDLGQRRDLPLVPMTRFDRMIVSTSPSGKTILINRFIQSLGFSQLEVVDGKTLVQSYSWKLTPILYQSYSISDTKLIARGNNRHMFVHSLHHPLWSLADQIPGPCANMDGPTFITDSLFVYDCDGTSLRSNDGQQLFHYSPEEGTRMGPIVVAGDGREVAVGTQRTKGIDFWDTGKGIKIISMEIVVYDLKLKKRLCKIGVTSIPNNDFAYSLSQDGSKLAVLNDRNISMYSIQSCK